jgi:hypothetical protein
MSPSAGFGHWSLVSWDSRARRPSNADKKRCHHLQLAERASKMENVSGYLGRLETSFFGSNPFLGKHDFKIDVNWNLANTRPFFPADCSAAANSVRSKKANRPQLSTN